MVADGAGIDIVRCEQLSVEDFVARYERPYVPCIISDIPNQEKWPAVGLSIGKRLRCGIPGGALAVSVWCAEGEAEAAGTGDRGTGTAAAGSTRRVGDAGDFDGPWTLRSLRRGFGERLFKVGEDDDGYKVRVKMKHFLRYLAANRDDSPLYVFDGE